MELAEELATGRRERTEVVQGIRGKSSEGFNKAFGKTHSMEAMICKED